METVAWLTKGVSSMMKAEAKAIMGMRASSRRRTRLYVTRELSLFSSWVFEVELLEVQQSGLIDHVEIAVIALILVAVALITVFKIYKGIDDRVDARIDARIKPSLDLLKKKHLRWLKVCNKALLKCQQHWRF